MGACPETGKVSYQSKSHAQREAAGVMRKPNGSKVSIFQCEHCGNWHFGRRRKAASKKRLLGRQSAPRRDQFREYRIR